MPLYTYRCQSCGFEFTKTQKFTEKPIKGCPQCRTNTMKRVPQLSAILFKGSGWYSIDQRSSSGQTRGPDSEKAKAERTPHEKNEG